MQEERGVGAFFPCRSACDVAVIINGSSHGGRPNRNESIAAAA